MRVSILIACHNEELSIKRCVLSCLKQSRKPDQIVVVNDGSTDNTLSILKTFGNKIKIVSLPKARGSKSIAQEKGLRYVTGSIVITTDGDTILDKNFVKNILMEFSDKNVVASAGYVKSIKQNWLTNCRQIDYLISQDIHKNAQSLINALYVIPGCAAAFRTNMFKKHISFDHDTLTEDLDFTYKFHRNRFKITFCKEAVVYTQDPSTIGDYIKQMRRWHGGNWQNLIKHISILNNTNNALELSLIYLEGIFFPLLLVIALLFNFQVFLYFMITYAVIIFLFTFFGAKRDKRWDLLLFIPAYFFVSFINYSVFIEQFVHEVLFQKKNLYWFKPARKVVYS